MKFKFIEERIATLFMYLAAFIVVAFLGSILWTIIKNGFPYLNWSMISKLPSGGFYIGGDGGILNAIVGSLYIVAGATILGLLISIPVVFYLNVYLTTHSKFAQLCRLTYDVLFGIPSIVYGAFGFTLMIYFGLRTSLLAGIIVITLLIIPIFIRSMDEAAKELPKDLMDATYSLGATRLEALKIFMKQIAPGIGTATFLSIGRAIGDTAGVLFTAGFTDNIPTALDEPAATLPLSIFFQLSSPSSEVREKAYAAALLLTLIILVLSILGRIFFHKYSKNKLR
ncbi:phosphate ABC transporter permease PstA [Apibacter muscae]|uniref:phosphate ABC transporter permease PstA n=1 Tax=Apibacter muscae TaxID=2509004 RepID=UPI0011AC48B5|nr:phosphate ABC transporter permease PstA [Apibacter muscae]TWP30449.1 phosphate ABC transporter permease PstA [Apibacter muscae]